MNNNWISCKTCKLTKQEKSFAIYMLSKINRSAKEVFEQAYEGQFLKEYLIYDDKDNRGVITIIVNYFRNYGFVQDSYGFEYSMNKTEEKIEELSNFELCEGLSFRKFEDEYTQDYLNLIEDSFMEQCLICGEKSELGENTVSWLKDADERNDFGALWKDDCLIGLYILDGEYISNIAVLSEYKGKGYGTVILNHCLKDIFINKEYNEAYLYVYAVNIKAQKMYLKNGFEVSAFYSENTYNKV